MEDPWLVTASALAIYCFVAVVTLAATWLVILAVWRRHFSRSPGARPPLGAQTRTLIEYLGNTSCPEAPSLRMRERRRNRAARLLMDHAREQAMEHDAPPSEVKTLVEKLREAIQAAEQVD